VVPQVAALPILYVGTTRVVLYVQLVSHAGYSNVSLRHFGRCSTTFPRSLLSFIFSDLWSRAKVTHVSFIDDAVDNINVNKLFNLYAAVIREYDI
jgi:hypothetical protein